MLSVRRGKDLMRKFNKALYDLKQVSRQWKAEIDDFLIDQLGLEKCASDQCLYLSWDPTSNTVAIIVSYFSYV